MTTFRADSASPRRRFGFWILARFRLMQIGNALDQQLRDAPGRAFVVVAMLMLIWGGLYQVLRQVLRHVGRYELVALVAKQEIFIHFFLVLAVMLAFSNAILTFGSLYGRREAGHLLAMPLSPQHAVCLKWLDGLVLSSWSFLLLGVPLMLAVGANTEVEWYYYPLFIGHFLGFVLIPSTLGALAAWAVAMWAPRRPRRVLLWCAGVAVAGAALWGWHAFRQAEQSEDWLRQFYHQLSIVRFPLLPSNWTAKGVFAAMEKRPELSAFYLGAVAANGLFLSWITINVLGRTWALSYSRASRGPAYASIRNGWFTNSLCTVFFPYLPPAWRALMLKDLRGFARDATQWTQMLIMIGLLVIYAANLRRLPIDLSNASMAALVAFLNLMTVSLILATFTSRFVFPLISLESQQLWLVGLLPTRRWTVLLVKFIFSLTVTGWSAMLVMGLAVRALALPWEWAGLQLAVSLAVCIGLSGLSVGIGARFPVLGQRNPARIAAGFGGTFNLVASMLFVALELAAVAYTGVIRFGMEYGSYDDIRVAPWLIPGVLVLGVLVAAGSLWVGGRRFERLEY